MTDTPDIDALRLWCSDAAEDKGFSLAARMKWAEAAQALRILASENAELKERAKKAEAAAESDRKYAAGLQSLYIIALAEITTLREAGRHLIAECRDNTNNLEAALDAWDKFEAALTAPSPAVEALGELVKTAKALHENATKADLELGRGATVHVSKWDFEQLGERLRGAALEGSDNG